MDNLNATPPILAALEDGIVIAGQTSDAVLAGVGAFDPGVSAESFVARLDHEGSVLWSTPVPDAGLPAGIAIDRAGDIVVAAPFMPASGGPTAYWAKLSPSGEIVREREIAFYSVPLSLAVDQTGDSYLGGWEPDPETGLSSYVVFARYDGSGNEIWKRRFHNNETAAEVLSLAIATNGDVLLTGLFNGVMDLGGGALVSPRPGWSSGFFARFTRDGDHVFSARFGGMTTLDVGTVVRALSDGGALLGGALSGTVEVLGESLTESAGGSGFLSRVDSADRARWAALSEIGITTAIAVDPDEALIHAAGHDEGIAWLAEYTPDGREVLLLRLPAEGYFFTHSLAVDSRRSLWLSGGFTQRADFGNGNVLLSAGAGVFLVRLDRD